jgi:hypothetical protein
MEARSALRTAPVFRDLSRKFARWGWPPEEDSDSDLFEKIVTIAQWNVPSAEFDTDGEKAVLPYARRLLARLDSGWFAIPSPTPKQAWFSYSPVFPEVQLSEGDSGKPLGALWTSSYLPDGTSTWSHCEDVLGTPESRAKGEDPPRTEYTVDIDTGGSAIYRISSPADFSRLLASYPRKGGHARVDWIAVAKEFDGVHLTARGLVMTQGAKVPTERGEAALERWDCESTAWLRTPKGLRLAG